MISIDVNKHDDRVCLYWFPAESALFDNSKVFFLKRSFWWCNAIELVVFKREEMGVINTPPLKKYNWNDRLLIKIKAQITAQG